MGFVIFMLFYRKTGKYIGGDWGNMDKKWEKPLFFIEELEIGRNEEERV